MLNPQEIPQLIDLLQRLDPTQISYAVQLAVQGKFALTAVETVIVNDAGQVLLLDRPDREPEIEAWRDKPHSPGSMLRETDNSFEDAFGRVQRSEINASFTGQPQLVTAMVLPTDRGTENSVVFLCQLAEEPKAGYWCDPENLPANLLSHHYAIIGVAAEAFRKQK